MDSARVSDLKDAVHGTTYPRVMHRDDHLGARSQERFDLPFVEVQGVGAAVDEDRARAPENERVRRRNESERRQHDFIARLDVEQQGGHLERVGARGGQQNAGGADGSLQGFLAQLGEVPVARNLAEFDGLADVIELLADQRGFVKGNLISDMRQSPMACFTT